MGFLGIRLQLPVAQLMMQLGKTTDKIGSGRFFGSRIAEWILFESLLPEKVCGSTTHYPSSSWLSIENGIIVTWFLVQSPALTHESQSTDHNRSPQKSWKMSQTTYTYRVHKHILQITHQKTYRVALEKMAITALSSFNSGILGSRERNIPKRPRYIWEFVDLSGIAYPSSLEQVGNFWMGPKIQPKKPTRMGTKTIVINGVT